MATVDEILTKQAYADGDESWTKDDNYPSYHLYVEPEYVPVTNKRIADFNDQISVRGEQNAQFVGFQLPRYDDGLDLTAQHLYIHYQTVYGGGDGVPCNVYWSDNYVRLCWQVPAQATQEPGTIQMMIYTTGTNSAGERVTWKTLPASYTIHDGLEIGGGIPEPDQSWYEQFVAQMEGKVSTAQGYANDAQASKTAAAGSATASAESAAASAQALEDNKAYVESQKETFVGYNRRETDLKYANALIGSASGTTQVTVDDAWEGDYTPPSRFVRTAFLKTHTHIPAGREEAALTCFHIMESVSIPKGPVITGRNTPDYTQYTAFINLSSREYFFRTYDNSCITSASLPGNPDTESGMKSLAVLNQPAAFRRLPESLGTF